MKGAISMEQNGTTVLVVTPQKTKFSKKNQKYYEKKQEKKRRDKIIRGNRMEKMQQSDIYSQKEYGRHNGSKPFEIYDKFVVVDRDHMEVNQQFMDRGEYEYSMDCLEVHYREFDKYMYNEDNNFNEKGRNKRAYSDDSCEDDMIQPSKKQKLETTSCSRFEIEDYWQARKDIEIARHNLEMATIDYHWMSEESREYLTFFGVSYARGACPGDEYDSSDDW